jgi:hypothetical protein
MADDLPERIAALLDDHHVMSLATVGAQGPHAASVFYARDGFSLLWVSDPESRHSRELAADARVAATIARDYSDFTRIHGLQLAGRARRVTGASDQAAARRILEARYEFLRVAADATVRDRYDHAQTYRLDPARIVLIDNRRGFGHREVFEPRRADAD